MLQWQHENLTLTFPPTASQARSLNCRKSGSAAAFTAVLLSAMLRFYWSFYWNVKWNVEAVARPAEAWQFWSDSFYPAGQSSLAAQSQTAGGLFRQSGGVTDFMHSYMKPYCSVNTLQTQSHYIHIEMTTYPLKVTIKNTTTSSCHSFTKVYSLQLYQLYWPSALTHNKTYYALSTIMYCPSTESPLTHWSTSTQHHIHWTSVPWVWVWVLWFLSISVFSVGGRVSSC